MKQFKNYGIFGALLLLILCAFWVDGAAVVQQAGTYFTTPSDVVMASTVSLVGFSRKERQKANLGGLSKVVMFGASDFTADWPVSTGITAGAITGTTIPVKVGATGAVLVFDVGSAEIKHDKKGGLGYQTFSHEFSCAFAGYEAAQKAALDKCLNEGAVIIGYMKDGTRIVAGTSYMPIVLEEEGSTGNKSADGGKISLKGKIEDGVGFAPPELASGVTVPLPA